MCLYNYVKITVSVIMYDKIVFTICINFVVILFVFSINRVQLSDVGTS